MRLFVLLLMLGVVGFSYDSVSYFKESPDNKLLCHLGQYSFMMVSQKNAVLEEIHGHMFFKIKDENIYLLNNACQALKDNNKGIIF